MQRTQNGKLSWGLVLLITAVVCAISLLGARLIGNRTGGMSFGEYKTFALTSNQGIQTVGDGFVYYNGSSLAHVSTGAQTQWTYMVGANASFSASDTGVAVWSGQTLTVIDCQEGTTTYSGSMGAEVLSARAGSKYTAVLLAPEHNSTIALLESGGKAVDRIAFANQTVIDYGFFSNGTLFWVMTLDTSGTTPVCAISTYKPGKMIVGSIRDTEQLMYQVVFQSSQVCCAGTTHLKTYDYTGTEDASRRKLVYGWYLAELESGVDDPMMAFVPDAQFGGADTIRDVRMVRSNLDQTVRMPYGCSSLVAKGSRVYGFSSDGKIMVAESGKQAVDAYVVNTLGGTVVGVTDNHVAVIASPNMAYLVKLP